MLVSVRSRGVWLPPRSLCAGTFVLCARDIARHRASSRVIAQRLAAGALSRVDTQRDGSGIASVNTGSSQISIAPSSRRTIE